ncbi:MAG TPA: RNA-binding S4 domain-containing protein [Pseudolabrys sp.]
MDRQRIDKWLWHARMVRTRSAAAALTESGFVRLNGKRVTAPGHLVRTGDVVTLALDRAVKVLQVEGFCERRGGPPAARALYRDLTTGSGAKACTQAGIPPRVWAGKGR